MRRRPLSSGSREVRRAVRNPPGASAAPSATSDARAWVPRAPGLPDRPPPRRHRPRRLTISERPSRQAFWKRAWRSSWGRSLKPVYLICKAERRTARNHKPNPRRRPPAPRGADKSQSRVCGRTAAAERRPARRPRRANFPPPGPTPGAPRPPRPPARPPHPHLTLAAQLPEKLLVFELASLVRHDARHLPALRPGRPGSGLARAPAGGLRADRPTARPPDRATERPPALPRLARPFVSGARPPAWAPAPVSLRRRR